MEIHLLKEKIGYEPSYVQWAASMKMSPNELNAKLMESSKAKEKLMLSNIRLVLSIARKYENMGVEMADLIQGITRALAEHSRTVRLPTHLHERLGLIRNAKLTLEVEGVSPSLESIATALNMSDKKVRNATEATKRMISLDREAYRRVNDTPNETLHNYIADPNLENRPWFTVERNTLKEDVNKFISSTLSKREQVIIRQYYGLDTRCSTWEDISLQLGLSRERVRQVGLVAMEKLRRAATSGKLEPIIVQA